MPGLRKAVIINGIEYKSIRQASIALKIPWSTVKWRMSQGYDPDVKRKAKSCCGQYSIREFCRQTGVTEKSLYCFLSNRKKYGLAYGMACFTRYHITKIFKKMSEQGEISLRRLDNNHSRVMFINLNGETVGKFYRSKFQYDGRLYVISAIEFLNILTCFSVPYIWETPWVIYSNIQSVLDKKICEKTHKRILKL